MGRVSASMRAHGERNHNEVWAYGKQAEPILAKYLRLRYQLLPYTYSVAYSSYQTGAPYMRALFMDFPADPKAADIPDEYMYGPAFLVAPVTEQGATQRLVYLPAGWIGITTGPMSACMAARLSWWMLRSKHCRSLSELEASCRWDRKY